LKQWIKTLDKHTAQYKHAQAIARVEKYACHSGQLIYSFIGAYSWNVR